MCTGDERLYGRKDSRSYLHNQTVAKKNCDCSLLLNRCDRSVFNRFVALSEVVFGLSYATLETTVALFSGRYFSNNGAQVGRYTHDCTLRG